LDKKVDRGEAEDTEQNRKEKAAPGAGGIR
jgi:hypothetical protein